MSADNGNPPNPPTVVDLIRRIGITGYSMVQNRAELLAVELREENIRLVELLVWGLATCFLGLLFLLVATGVVIFLFPPGGRIYVALGFCILYLAGATMTLLNLKALAKTASTPFSATIDEMKKDSECIESFK